MSRNSLQALIDDLPEDERNSIVKEDSIPVLNAMLEKGRNNADRSAVIKARIENLQHLVI